MYRKMLFVVSTMMVSLSWIFNSYAEEGEVDRKKMSRAVFATVKRSIAMVKCRNSVGSGFILMMEGRKKYFVTNNHVFDGDETISAKLLDGTKIKLGTLEIAQDMDLVRFRVDDGLSALKLAEGSPDVGEDVFVYGNSDGGGVATDLSGEILGVGPEKIEVSVPFVHGNSGSAVLNMNGDVLGVATYATLDADPNDWTKAKTRFVEPRRYALRLTSITWKPVDFLTYCKKIKQDRRDETAKKRVVPEIDASFATPKIEWVKPTGGELGGMMAYVDLNIKSAKDHFKSPIVRVCCLLKDDNGEKLFVDLIFDEVGKDWRCCPPVWSYGDANDGWEYSIGNDQYVYFLEGLSYWRRPIAKDVKNRRMIYCSDGKNRKPGRLLGRGHSFWWSDSNVDDVYRSKGVKVLCYRYECWQNGALASVYDSKSESQLRSIGIPCDWYKKQKHSDKFNLKLCPKPRKKEPTPQIIVVQPNNVIL